MATKIIFTTFIVLLSSALVLTKPIIVDDDHFKDYNLCGLKNIWTALASSEKDSTLKPTIQLMKVAMFDLQNMVLRHARTAKNISDHLLKDDVINSNKSPQVVEFKENMEEYQKKYTACSDMEELFNSVESYSNATSHYYKMEREGSLNADSNIIYNVLKKYSDKDLDEEFKSEFLNTFVSKFSQKINQIKEQLEKEEGDLGVKILQWWDKMKSLQTADEKMEAFKDYVKLYDVDIIRMSLLLGYFE